MKYYVFIIVIVIIIECLTLYDDDKLKENIGDWTTRQIHCIDVVGVRERHTKVGTLWWKIIFNNKIKWDDLAIYIRR